MLSKTTNTTARSVTYISVSRDIRIPYTTDTDVCSDKKDKNPRGYPWTLYYRAGNSTVEKSLGVPHVVSDEEARPTHRKTHGLGVSIRYSLGMQLYLRCLIVSAFEGAY